MNHNNSQLDKSVLFENSHPGFSPTEVHLDTVTGNSFRFNKDVHTVGSLNSVSVKTEAVKNTDDQTLFTIGKEPVTDANGNVEYKPRMTFGPDAYVDFGTATLQNLPSGSGGGGSGGSSGGGSTTVNASDVILSTTAAGADANNDGVDTVEERINFLTPKVVNHAGRTEVTSGLGNLAFYNSATGILQPSGKSLTSYVENNTSATASIKAITLAGGTTLGGNPIAGTSVVVADNKIHSSVMIRDQSTAFNPTLNGTSYERTTISPHVIQLHGGDNTLPKVSLVQGDSSVNHHITTNATDDLVIDNSNKVLMNNQLEVPKLVLKNGTESNTLETNSAGELVFPTNNDIIMHGEIRHQVGKIDTFSFTNTTETRTVGDYTNVTATSTSGSGLSAAFTVEVQSNFSLIINLDAGGFFYNVNDTLTLAGSSIGGGSDVVLTVTTLTPALDYVHTGNNDIVKKSDTTQNTLSGDLSAPRLISTSEEVLLGNNNKLSVSGNKINLTSHSGIVGKHNTGSATDVDMFDFSTTGNFVKDYDATITYPTGDTVAYTAPTTMTPIATRDFVQTSLGGAGPVIVTTIQTSNIDLLEFPSPGQPALDFDCRRLSTFHKDVTFSGPDTVFTNNVSIGVSATDLFNVNGTMIMPQLSLNSTTQSAVLTLNANKEVVARDLADTDGVVVKTGAQSVAGVKTFLDHIVVGATNTQITSVEDGVINLTHSQPSINFNTNVQLTQTSSNTMTCQNADFVAGNGSTGATLFSHASFTGWTGLRNSALTPTNNNYAILQSNTGSTQTSCAAGSANTMTVAGVGYLRAFNNNLDAFYPIYFASGHDVSSSAYPGVNGLQYASELANPTFTNLTVASTISTGGTGKHTLQVSKIGNRVVIRGYVETTQSPPSWTAGDVIATLPVAYRSTKLEYMQCSPPTDVKIETNGNITIDTTYHAYSGLNLNHTYYIA